MARSKPNPATRISCGEPVVDIRLRSDVALRSTGAIGETMSEPGAVIHDMAEADALELVIGGYAEIVTECARG